MYQYYGVKVGLWNSIYLQVHYMLSSVKHNLCRRWDKKNLCPNQIIFIVIRFFLFTVWEFDYM